MKDPAIGVDKLRASMSAITSPSPDSRAITGEEEEGLGRRLTREVGVLESKVW